MNLPYFTVNLPPKILFYKKGFERSKNRGLRGYKKGFKRNKKGFKRSQFTVLIRFKNLFKEVGMTLPCLLDFPLYLYEIKHSII